MKIFFVSGVRSGEELEFSIPEITVGRELDNILELPVDGVSRYHGKLVLGDDGSWSVVDLGSTNGVKVNRRVIDGSAVLKEGDLIEFGDQMLRVTGLTAPPPPISFAEIPETPAAGPIVFTPIEPTAPEPEVKKAAEAAPPASPAASPAAATAPGGDAIGEWRDLLKKGGDKMFSAASGRKEGAAAKSEAGASPRKKLFNMVFYLAIAFLVVAGVAVFHKQEESRKQLSAAKEEQKDSGVFVMRYVKENITQDNIFRFELVVDGGTAHFVIDDLKSNRKYETQPKAIAEESLELLRRDIEYSNFLALEQQEQGSAANNLDERRKLMVISGDKRNEVEIVNTSAPRAFLDAESAINSFAETYGLQTISLTPEELKEQAESGYRKGKDLFDNWQAERTNLRNSIRYLQLAVSYLDQFTPKPPVWDKARKLLDQARKLQDRQIQEFKSEYANELGMKNYSRARELLLQLMDTSDMDSKLYENTKRELIKLDAALLRIGKDKKK